MTEYVPTIGLEIHAELKTATKMFCNSRNDPDEKRPNVNICPICLAHPGTLPVINREAVRHVLRVGAAFKGHLADYAEFDRKNYFYPDLPKGYQISQYEFPLVSGGELAGVEITRVHLEEDTASSIHMPAPAGHAGGQAGDENTGETLIDYNRAGIPLMELVTEPVIRSAKDAGKFARELQLLLRYLGASDANMEKGEMRVEANISVAKVAESRGDTLGSLKVPPQILGTKVEVKNINSFRAMERAIEYEIKRQSKLLETGKTVIQETRGWDEAKESTFPQRVKEGSADYRYFPDPDLPNLRISEVSEFVSTLEKNLPELPYERRNRYLALGIKSDDAEQYVENKLLGDFFDEVCSKLPGAKSQSIASNYISNDLVNIISSSAKAMADGRDIKGRDTQSLGYIPISRDHFAKIISLLGSGAISSRVAKDLLLHAIAEKKDPETIASERGLMMSESVSSAVEEHIDAVLAANPKVVSDYKSGKDAALQFLIGQCMKALKGAIDPAKLREAILRKIQ